MATADATRRVADRYVLESALGKGGMGVVWRARDTVLNRTVAVKEIQIPERLQTVDMLSIQARVMREARSAARLAHPGVVTIYDVVQERSQSFIIMEFVDAPTLEDLINERGPLAADEAAALGLDILAALETAHANGIVHRDVKPSNILITQEGRAKLSDFGIATVKDDPKITSTGIMLGSPQFMAPEQAQGTASGPAADLWALGATLYFAVEGRYPFDRGEAIPTLAAVVHDDFAPLRLSGALTPAITALLVKEPELRPTENETRRLLEGTVPSAAAPQARLQSPSRPEPLPPAPHAEARVPARTRWPMALVLLVVVAAVASVLVSFLDDARPPVQGRDDDVESGSSRGSDESSPAEESAPSGATVPASWARYRDPEVGYRLAYPQGWQLIQDAANSIDFRDPETGTYLRVQWTTTPGPSPEGAWETQAESFAATHSDYEEVGITPTTYKGYDAAVWEFLYTEDGARLHAADLGFVMGDDYGFALYFQTHEEDWETSQDLFEKLKAAFRPPRV
jgi:serine/threonine protein kinase